MKLIGAFREIGGPMPIIVVAEIVGGILIIHNLIAP